MSDKKTMTLNLPTNEMDAIEKLSVKRGISKTALVRQAIRLYHDVCIRMYNGEKLFIDDGAEKSALMVVD